MKENREKWLEWIKQLQALAQAGLYYGGTEFDKERYQAIRDIAAGMMSDLADLPLEKIQDLFCNESGYQTPKLASRAAVFLEDKMLMVQENYGKWTMPGGWAEPGYSLRENAIKEVEEESGIIAEADYMIAFIDKDKHSPRMHPFSEEVVYVHCSVVDGQFQKNSETIAMKYFTYEEICQLEIDERKAALEQIKMCFDAHKICPGKPEEYGNNWTIIWD